MAGGREGGRGGQAVSLCIRSIIISAAKHPRNKRGRQREKLREEERKRGIRVRKDRGGESEREQKEKGDG